MSFKKKIVLTLAVVLVLASAGGLFFYYFADGKNEKSTKEKRQARSVKEKSAARESAVRENLPLVEDPDIPRQTLKPGEKRPDKSLFVMGWDGAGWRNVKMLLEQGRLPNLKSLIEKTGRSPFPLELHGKTNTANVWTQIWTGLDPDQSGVSGNGYFYSNNNGCPNYVYNKKDNLFNYGYWIRQVPYTHTIAAPLHRRGVSIGWFVSKGANTGGKDRSPLGALSKYADDLLFVKPAKNEQFNDYTKLLGEEFEENYDIKDKESIDALKSAMEKSDLEKKDKQTLSRKIEKYSGEQFTDDYIFYLGDAAKKFIAERKDNFAVFLLANPDYYGHVHGENGARYLDEFVRADGVLGEILGVLPKDTKIIVLADHGFDEDNTGHLNATDAWGWTNLPIYEGYEFQKKGPQRAFATARDVAVTMMDYFGVEWEKEYPLRRGKSLLK